MVGLSCPKEQYKQLILSIPMSNKYGKLQCNFCKYYFTSDPWISPNSHSKYYCSNFCLHEDSSHQNGSDHLNKNSLPNLSKHSESSHQFLGPGLLGLENLGNTCYMNSCLQCLSHTKIFTQYFLSKSYQSQINKANSNSKGALAYAYFDLLKNLWEGKQTFNPTRFRKLAGELKKTFQGYAQQDAYQFLNWLISELHEDLNRVGDSSNKKIATCTLPEDLYQSENAWVYYAQKNQSIITDYMTGLFKSTIICGKQNCNNRQSKRFQPFNSIILSIPKKQIRFLIVSHQFTQCIYQHEFEYASVQQDQISKELSRKLNGQDNQYKLFLVSEKMSIIDCEKVQRQDFQIALQESIPALFQLSYQQQGIINRFALSTQFSWASETKALQYKRPFFIDINQQTYQSLCKKILRYLYLSVYKQRRKVSAYRASGVSYDNFEKRMLQNRPFCLVMVDSKQKKNRVLRPGEKIKKGLNELRDLCKDKKYDIDQHIVIGFLEMGQLQSNYELVFEFKKECQQLFDFSRVKIDIKQFHSESKKPIKIEECLNLYKMEEKLEKYTEWECSNCKEKRRPTKKMQIYKLPQILVMLISRFKTIANGERKKNETFVQFPELLDMSSFVMSYSPTSSYIEACKSKNIYINPSYNVDSNVRSQNLVYQLYGFINHKGTLKSGHYTANIKSNGKWYLFNDKIVEELKNVPPQNFAYVLFYQRKLQKLQ